MLALNFDSGRKNEIIHNRLKEQFKISEIAKFGYEMLTNIAF